jgi:predicted RND superfamily exporter protein
MELGLMVAIIIFLNGLGAIVFIPSTLFLMKPKFMTGFEKK